MTSKRVFVVTAVLLASLFSLTSLLQTVSSAPQATILLYDSTLGTTPAQQNFDYLAINTDFPFTVEATQIYSAPVTVLNTFSQIGDYAGNTISQTVMPSLSRTDGFQLTFDLRVISESHDSGNDRAGFNVILLSEDLYGVEMAFWENEIWVQEGNDALFTPAEGVLYNTTTALTTYDLTVISDTYLLEANDVPLLSGSLRQYTDWDSGGLPDPYEQPNQLFLGDDTSSAGAEVWLGDVLISTDIAPTVSVEQTAVSLPETTTQTTLIVDLDTMSPLTTTVQYSVTSGTATAGQDFVASSGTLTFTPGSLSENISLTLLPDDVPEADETFNVTLFGIENGKLGEGTAVFTIQDDDVAYDLFLPYVVKP